MEPLEYKKLEVPEKTKCVYKTRYQFNNLQCSFPASYKIGDKLLCKKHAMTECLKLVLEGFAD
jgi:hypothetical protein